MQEIQRTRFSHSLSSRGEGGVGKEGGGEKQFSQFFLFTPARSFYPSSSEKQVASSIALAENVRTATVAGRPPGRHASSLLRSAPLPKASIVLSNPTRINKGGRERERGDLKSQPASERRAGKRGGGR